MAEKPPQTTPPHPPASRAYTMHVAGDTEQLWTTHETTTHFHSVQNDFQHIWKS